MKILYLANSVIPSRHANSVHVMRMCESFAALGNEVVLAVRRQPRREVKGIKDLFAYYGVKRVFRVARFRSPRRFEAAWFVLRSLHLVLREKPDVVYGRSAIGLALPSLLGVPTYYETHGPIWEAPAFDRGLYRVLVGGPGFRGSVYNTDALRRMYVARGGRLARRPTLVAHNGAEDGSAVPAALRAEPGGRLRIGYTGQFYAGRGVELIVALARSRPTDAFHVVGGSEEDLPDGAAPCPANLTLHGFVAPALVAGYRNSFDILLAPYQSRVFSGGRFDSSSYMCPLKLLEYLSAGRPIVCSDIPVLREIVDESVAVMTDSNEVSAWSAAIDLLGDPELRAAMGARGRARFESRHTWKGRARRILDFVAATGPRRCRGETPIPVSTR